MSDAPRIVFDCNVFLQALSAPEGPAGSCVQLAIDGKVNLFVSPAVLEELRDVTSRPKVIAKLADASKPDGADFLARFPELKIFSPVEFLKQFHSAERNEQD